MQYHSFGCSIVEVLPYDKCFNGENLVFSLQTQLRRTGTLWTVLLNHFNLDIISFYNFDCWVLNSVVVDLKFRVFTIK